MRKVRITENTIQRMVMEGVRKVLREGNFDDVKPLSAFEWDDIDNLTGNGNEQGLKWTEDEKRSWKEQNVDGYKSHPLDFDLMCNSEDEAERRFQDYISTMGRNKGNKRASLDIVISEALRRVMNESSRYDIHYLNDDEDLGVEVEFYQFWYNEEDPMLISGQVNLIMPGEQYSDYLEVVYDTRTGKTFVDSRVKDRDIYNAIVEFVEREAEGEAELTAAGYV